MYAISGLSPAGIFWDIEICLNLNTAPNPPEGGLILCITQMYHHTSEFTPLQGGRGAKEMEVSYQFMLFERLDIRILWQKVMH